MESLGTLARAQARPGIAERGSYVRPANTLGCSYTPRSGAICELDRDSLLTYLNDHLAASVAALKLMERVREAERESQLGATLADFAMTARREQQLVQRIVDAFDGGEGPMKKALAWLGELASRLKIGGSSSMRGKLQLFETLELLSVGFYGRRSCWQTLERLKHAGVLRLDLDFPRLIASVDEQLLVLETMRLDASTSALSIVGGAATN